MDKILVADKQLHKDIWWGQLEQLASSAHWILWNMV
jgi:hypothetical protein